MAFEDLADAETVSSPHAVDRSDGRLGAVDGRIESQQSVDTTLVISQILTRIQVFSQAYASSFEGVYQRDLLHDVQSITQTLTARRELPVDIHAAAQSVMSELAAFYLHQTSPSYVRGDMYSALMYLAIAQDFFHQTERELPQRFYFFLEQIEMRIILDSPLERLHGILKSRLPVREVQQHHTPDPHEDLFSELPIYELVKLAAGAKKRDDWRAVLEYQHAIAAREPSNTISTQAIFHLAKAYANVGDIERALEIVIDLKNKPFITPEDVQSADACIAQLQSRLSSRGREVVIATWPERYSEFTSRDYPRCPLSVLFRYSLQAQDARDYQTVVLIQEAVIQYPEYINRAVAYVVLSKAYAALGKLDDALRVTKIAVQCPDYRPSSPTFDAVAYLTALINRRDAPDPRSQQKASSRAPDAVTALPPVPAVARIERLIAQSRPAVDAVIASPVAPPKPAVVDVPLTSPLIDTSQFHLFFQSFVTHASSWKEDSVRGEGWYKVPDLEKRVAMEYLAASAKWAWKRILKETPGGDTILRAIDTFEKHVQRGSIQLSVLADFQERYAKLPGDVQVQLAQAR